MQTIILQDIRDAIFGELGKAKSDHGSDTAALAKRTGLLMLAKLTSDWKEDYGGKIESIEATINGSRAEANQTGGLLGSSKRIEDVLGTTPYDPENPEHTLSFNPPNGINIGPWKMVRLETENDRLKKQMEDLMARLGQAEESMHQAATMQEDNEALQKEVDVLRQSLRNTIHHFAEQQELAYAKSHWMDEAWDMVMDAFWPQGSPSTTNFELGTTSQHKIPTGSPYSSVAFGDKPVGNQAGRGGSGGSGTGSCAVM